MSGQNGEQPGVNRRRVHERSIADMEGPDHEGRARLLEFVSDSDLRAPDDEPESPSPLRNLRAKDFPLANFDEMADTFEFKGLQEVLRVINEARYPHPESVLQGAVREWAFDEPGEALEAREPDEMVIEETFLLGTYSRATRGEEGMQQEVSAKQSRESIAIDEGGGSGGGLRSRIPGL